MALKLVNRRPKLQCVLFWQTLNIKVTEELKFWNYTHVVTDALFLFVFCSYNQSLGVVKRVNC